MHNTDKIPDGWAKAKISDLFDFIGGGTPSKNEFRFWNGEIPWASVKDIKGSYLTSTQDLITEIGLANSAANIANPGEVILITRISPGKVVTTKIKTAINQDLKIVRPKYDANPDFIRYLFNTLEKECIKLSSGTTVLGITLDVLNDINIIIPPLNEQNRIVEKLDELLSELEKGKEQLQTSLEQLKVYRQSILKYAFEGKLTNENVKEGKLPEGWNWRMISEVCKMKAGFFIKAAEINENHTTGSYPCYGGNGLRGYVNTFTHEGMFPLVGRQGALCGNVHLVNGKFHATEHAVVVTPNEQIEVKWLYYKLISMRLNQYSAGAAQPGLSVNRLLPIQIAIPPKSEQKLIVSELESKITICSNMEETIQLALNQIESLKQSLLQKAFEGKLVEQDPTDEPASVLLERIKKEREAYLKAEKERKKQKSPMLTKKKVKA